MDLAEVGGERVRPEQHVSRECCVLMAPRTDRTTRIPSGVVSPVTTNHAAKESVFVNLRNTGIFKNRVR